MVCVIYNATVHLCSSRMSWLPILPSAMKRLKNIQNTIDFPMENNSLMTNCRASITVHLCQRFSCCSY